jgi:uncharacterized protein YdeI (YjbR/CyaY-like superfamily)
MRISTKPVFFSSPSEWRAWLEEHHQETLELWVGFHKKHSGKHTITWPEAVDSALCFGWIDGIRKRLDEVSYTIRFTPRRARSTWSAVNIKRVAELKKSGLMQPSGVRAFKGRTDEKSEIYAYEQRKGAALGRAYERLFRERKAAWSFFQAQPPWYRRTATWWVISAKKEETRLRRLATLIEDSEAGRTIRALIRPGKSK